MQDMHAQRRILGVAAVLEPPLHADSNEGMVVKLIILVRKGGESLESPSRLELICFKTSRFKFSMASLVLWSLVQKEIFNLLHTCCSFDAWHKYNTMFLENIILTYTILFADVSTFPDIMIFLISLTYF